jgi:hypothetical protein
MDVIFQWLTANPIMLTIIIVSVSIALIALTLLYVIAFLQGRTISFWPPNIGSKISDNEPSSTNNKLKPDSSSIANVKLARDRDRVSELNLANRLETLNSLDLLGYTLIPLHIAILDDGSEYRL